MAGVTGSNFLGMALGVISMVLGCTIAFDSTPSIGKYGYGSYPTFHWVGWVLIACGCACCTISLHGLYTARKKERERREGQQHAQSSPPPNKQPDE